MRLLILATALATGIAGIADSAQSQFLGASNRSSANSAACRSAYGVPNDACSMPTGTLGSHDYTTVDIDTSGFLACYLNRSDPQDDSCLESGIADDLNDGAGAEIAPTTDVPVGFAAAARSARFLGGGSSSLSILDNAANGYKFDLNTLGSFTAGCWVRDSDDTFDFNFGKLGDWNVFSQSTGQKVRHNVRATFHTHDSPVVDQWYNWRVKFTLLFASVVYVNEDAGTGIFIGIPGAPVDKYFGVGQVPGNFFPLVGSITECYVVDYDLDTVDTCRICRCGLMGDHIKDFRSTCAPHQVGRNKCAMSTNKCYSS